jgi:hypothetical protein
LWKKRRNQTQSLIRCDLDIRTDKFCSGDDPHPFIVTPGDGEVKTKDPTLSDCVQQDENGKFVFVPSEVISGKFGTAIGFTVNETDVPLTVAVSSNPIAKILEPCDYRKSRLILQFILKAQENPAAEGDFEYNWTFGDGSTMNGQEIQAHFKKAQFDGEIPVTLTVTNGPCTSTDSITIPFQGEEPTTTCQEIVTGFIINKQDLLGLPTTQNAIKKLGNRSINAIYASVKNLFDGAASLAQKPTPARILTLLQAIDQQLRKIYELSPPPNNPAAARVLEEFIRLLLMLMLNLVRCFDKIPDDHINLILEHFSALSSSIAKLRKKYPQLNEKNNLENDAKAFCRNLYRRMQD